MLSKEGLNLTAPFTVLKIRTSFRLLIRIFTAIAVIIFSGMIALGQKDLEWRCLKIGIQYQNGEDILSTTTE